MASVSTTSKADGALLWSLMCQGPLLGHLLGVAPSTSTDSGPPTDQLLKHMLIEMLRVFSWYVFHSISRPITETLSLHLLILHLGTDWCIAKISSHNSNEEGTKKNTEIFWSPEMQFPWVDPREGVSTTWWRLFLTVNGWAVDMLRFTRIQTTESWACSPPHPTIIP